MPLDSMDRPGMVRDDLSSHTSMHTCTNQKYEGGKSQLRAYHKVWGCYKQSHPTAQDVQHAKKGIIK